MLSKTKKGIANVRALALALTVVAFVILSSYVYLGTQSVGSPTRDNLNPNSTDQQTIQNSATFSQQPVATQTATAQYFGNNYFEPPSAILITANTLVWTNFQLTGNTNAFVAASTVFFPFPDSIGANMTVALYSNGHLVANSTTTVPDHNYGINFSLIPSSTSSNSIFAITGLTPTSGVGTQTLSALSLNGTTITVAVISDKSIWLAGWTATDKSKGSGTQFGVSIGQLAGTYEATEPSISLLPSSLPSATTSLTFELQIPGVLMA